MANSLVRVVMLGFVAAWATACAGDRDRPVELDLLGMLPGAERRSAGHVDEDVRGGIAGIPGDERTALVLRAPARVTWLVELPRHARMSFALVLVPGVSAAPQGVTIRIGLSDQRRYRDIGNAEATSAWMPIALDLREYSEWKFSLFDQPLLKRWQLVVNADATPGGTVALERPRLTRS